MIVFPVLIGDVFEGAVGGDWAFTVGGLEEEELGEVDEGGVASVAGDCGADLDLLEVAVDFGARDKGGKGVGLWCQLGLGSHWG